jgi:hypothetical protein
MRRLFLALALLIAAPGAAVAEDLPNGGMTIPDIVDGLHAQGLTAEIDTSKDGTRNVVASSEGVKFRIYQFDCKGDRCASLQFSEGFDTKGAFGPGPMNDWNRENRWTRAYVDKVNDPWLEMDVDLAPGGSFEMLNDELATWRMCLINFRKEIKW